MSWEDYESGPLCRHWSDFSECDLVCLACNHGCQQHYEDENPGCTCCRGMTFWPCAHCDGHREHQAGCYKCATTK